MTIKILLLGGTGQVGSELYPLLAKMGELTAFGRREVDLADPDCILRVLEEVRPNLIVNAAAFTMVDLAETQSDLAEAVNAHAPAVLAEGAKNMGAVLVHYSTDYVFGGDKSTPYNESDETNPINTYGKTKLAGEQAIRDSGASHLILRTSWVYGTRGKNFLLTILRLAAQKEEISVVADQIGAPTWSRMLALGTSHILSTIVSRKGGLSAGAEFSGVYHLTADGQASWHKFAQAIVDECSASRKRPPWLIEFTGGRPLALKRIIPIATNAYPTPARRPAYSMLCNNKVLQVFGVRLPHWRVQLQLAFRDIPAEEILSTTIEGAPSRTAAAFRTG